MRPRTIHRKMYTKGGLELYFCTEENDWSDSPCTCKLAPWNKPSSIFGIKCKKNLELNAFELVSTKSKGFRSILPIHYPDLYHATKDNACGRLIPLFGNVDERVLTDSQQIIKVINKQLLLDEFEDLYETLLDRCNYHKI